MKLTGWVIVPILFLLWHAIFIVLPWRLLTTLNTLFDDIRQHAGVNMLPKFNIRAVAKEDHKHLRRTQQ